MDRREAEAAARQARALGWHVHADLSPERSWRRDEARWWLRARAADGGAPLYVKTRDDLAVLTLGGQIAARGDGGPPYRVRIEDRRAEGGAFVVYVYRECSCVAVGASRVALRQAVDHALLEARCRRRAGQFRGEG